MDPVTIQMLVLAGIKIYQRHLDATGEKLTDAQVLAQLRAELQNGQNEIAAWFASKGLPIPF